MQLLISANSFHPGVGGYERVALTIAQQLCLRGHSVKLVTLTRGQGDLDFPFEIYRNPSVLTLLKLIKWSDIYIQNNVSLKLIWPIFIFRRPLVCVHHGFYKGPNSTIFSWRYRLKHLITRFSNNIAVSRAVAATLPGKSVVAANPYRDELFFRIPSIAKDRDLIFVGRLVSDKGVDLLIDALSKLRGRGLNPSLTIVGSGPEEAALRNKVHELGLGHLVSFAGRVSDQTLNELLNAHRIMAVPTRYGEGFGVVALEGIACGCVVVGSSDGGLPEAIGPCGRTFPNHDAAALGDLLYDLLTHPETWQDYLAHSKAHLDAHRPSVVAEKYLEVLTQLNKSTPLR